MSAHTKTRGFAQSTETTKRRAASSDTADASTANAPSCSSKPKASTAIELSKEAVHTARLVIIALILSAVATGYLTRDDAVRYAGYLQAEKQIVVAPCPGLIEFVDVDSGQVVLPGHPLCHIMDGQLKKEIELATIALEDAKSRLATVQAKAQLDSDQAFVSIDQEIFKTKLQLASLLESEYQHKFEATAVRPEIDLLEALRSNAVPIINVDSAVVETDSNSSDSFLIALRRATAQNRLESVQARISLCENHLDTLKERRGDVAKQLNVVHQVAKFEQQVAARQADLDELEERESELEIKSELYGMAGNSNIQDGKHVKAGDVLLELFDRDREFIHVQLPSSVITSIKPGGQVRLLFPGNEERIGKINTVPPQVTVAGTKAHPESLVDLKVVTTGMPWPTVPIGSTVYVNLLDENDVEDAH